MELTDQLGMVTIKNCLKSSVSLTTWTMDRMHEHQMTDPDMCQALWHMRGSLYHGRFGCD